MDLECQAEFFNSAGIKVWNFVKFRGISLNTQLRKIRIQSELFFDGIGDTLDGSGGKTGRR